MFNLKNIVEGWKNLAFPTPLTEEMAAERGETCSVCPHSNPQQLITIFTKNDHVEKIRGLGCELCGCPLSAKLRVPLERCPDKRWSVYSTKPNKMNTTNIHILKEAHQKQLGDIAQKAATIAFKKDLSITIVENADKALKLIVKQRNMILSELQEAKTKISAELTPPTSIIEQRPEGEDTFTAENEILEICNAILKSMATINTSKIVEPSTNKKFEDGGTAFTKADEKIIACVQSIIDAVQDEISDPKIYITTEEKPKGKKKKEEVVTEPTSPEEQGTDAGPSGL